MRTAWFAGWMLCAATAAWADFGFDEMEALERTEQEALLEQARQAARDWRFSEAEDYLEQARNKGYAPEAVRAVERLIADQRAARDRQRQEERRLAQQRRQADGGRGASGGGSAGGGEVDYVMVQFEVTCGFSSCIPQDLVLSGGPGFFSDGAGASGSIHKGVNGIAGTYRWVGTFESYGETRGCSGSVRISGRKRFVTIGVYSDCQSAGVFEY